MMSDRDDAQLVRAVLGGEEEAFDELVRRYRKAAFGAAFSKLGDYDAALDVTQEALVAAYLQLHTLSDPHRFAAWLYRIAGNLALMRIRRHRPTVPLESVDASELASLGSDPHKTAERLDETQQLRQALSHLPEADRSAVILHYLGGYSHAEVGDVLGTSAASVKSRIYRARRRLREEMLDTMHIIGDRLPDIEVTEELLERILVRTSAGEHGIVAHLGGVPGALPGMPQYTERTRAAVLRIADRLRKEGCKWLYAPPHLPDDSPALPMFRSLGFEAETEMRWYERDLRQGAITVPLLASGCEMRPLGDANPSEVLELLRATSMRHAPDAVDEDHVRAVLRDENVAGGASLAAYCESRLAAVVLALGVSSWQTWKYEPGSGILWWTAWQEAVAPDPVIAHMIGASLAALKKAGFRRAVKDQLSPSDDLTMIEILKSQGFSYMRSQWNLKLRL